MAETSERARPPYAPTERWQGCAEVMHRGGRGLSLSIELSRFSISCRRILLSGFRLFWSSTFIANGEGAGAGRRARNEYLAQLLLGVTIEPNEKVDVVVDGLGPVGQPASKER